MRQKGSVVVQGVREFSAEARDGLVKLMESLADGDTVRLGDFGDAGHSTDADEQAAILREFAHALRR